MKSLKVIQLGDVHFPDHKDTLIGDLKDSAVAASLIKAVAPNRLQLVMRKIAQVAEDPSVCGLLICGDLTTKGDLDGYGSCVEYLDKAMEVGSTAKWNGDSLHVWFPATMMSSVNCVIPTEWTYLKSLIRW